MPRDLEEFLRKAAQRRQQQRGSGSADFAAEKPEVRAKSPSRSKPPVESSLESRRPSRPSKVDLADERMDAQLHDHFDHGLGGLAEPTHSVTASDSPDAATDQSNIMADLIYRLQQPEGVQQAILLNEILNRPTHRWD
jgi:hypothetical protein